MQKDKSEKNINRNKPNIFFLLMLPVIFFSLILLIYSCKTTKPKSDAKSESIQEEQKVKNEKGLGFFSFFKSDAKPEDKEEAKSEAKPEDKQEEQKVKNDKGLGFFSFFKSEAKSESTQEETKVKVEESIGAIPFFKSGSFAFSEQKALQRMEERRERERESLEKEKGEFHVLAEDRYRGLAFHYWIPAPEYPNTIRALRGFPRDTFGYPDWVAAVRKGIINPADTITGEVEEEEMFDEDVIFEINDRMMANVIFPHSVHNYWLSCKVCHPGIFIAKKGANDVAMTKIWGGKFCGRCHGAVAFIPKGFENCIRCHSVGRKKVFMNY